MVQAAALWCLKGPVHHRASCTHEAHNAKQLTAPFIKLALLLGLCKSMRQPMTHSYCYMHTTTTTTPNILRLTHCPTANAYALLTLSTEGAGGRAATRQHETPGTTTDKSRQLPCKTTLQNKVPQFKICKKDDSLATPCCSSAHQPQ